MFGNKLEKCALLVDLASETNSKFVLWEGRANEAGDGFIIFTEDWG